MFPMMHSRFLLICCVIYSVIWPSSAHPDCGPYERQVECIDQCQRCEYKNGGCAQPAVCIPGCDCIPGFFRNKQKQCIPAAFCPAPGPAQQCGVYEIPVKCIDQCQTCKYKNVNCSQGAVCIPGCDCIPGFLRNQQKQCIPAHECPGPPQQCPAGEFPVKCIDRCQRCEYKNGNCAQIGVCTPGCNCVPGFLRDSTNKCIPADFCPGTGPGPAQQCPADEIPVGCIDRCQRCEYKNGNCAQAQVCTPGCNCVPGFLRDSTNKCIPANFCPGFPCLQEVDSGPCYAYITRFYFNKKTGECEDFIYGGCKGNANNFVVKELCEAVCKGPPRPQQCPAGEIPVKCIDRCQRCEYKNGNCSQIQVCTPGCNCVPGFLRDSKNKCIPADFCPVPIPTQQCGQYERPVKCIDQCQTCKYKNGGCVQPAVCIPGCDCIPGFFRNEKKKCIPAALCPGPGPTQQCGQYERPVECIDQCQTCEYRNGGCGQPAVCIPGCDCIPGFFRNKQKQCIPAAFCPGTGPGPAQQCPAYEYPVPCIDRCQTCEYKNGHCIQTGECTPGCNCVPGFLRDKTKKCIPASKCP